MNSSSSDFSAVYLEWFPHVCRWVRALGGRSVDVEDLAQEVFLVVERRLPAFDGKNLPGWLFRIAALTVRGYRRRSWFRHLVLKRKDESLDRVSDPGGGPVTLLERRERRRIVVSILERMRDKHRVPFVLFEIEGYEGEEIARLLDIPVATVWTRLHYARKQFLALAAASRARDAGAGGGR